MFGHFGIVRKLDDLIMRRFDHSPLLGSGVERETRPAAAKAPFSGSCLLRLRALRVW